MNNVQSNNIFEWLRKNGAIPDDDDTGFVFRYELSKHQEKKLLRFFYTSKFFLRNVLINGLVCIDATYKLNTLDIPVYIIGTVDNANHFHFIGIGCCSTETKEDYSFFFQAAKDAAASFGLLFAPTTLLSDGAMAIINAFYEVFSETAQDNNMCHV